MQSTSAVSKFGPSALQASAVPVESVVMAVVVVFPPTAWLPTVVSETNSVPPDVIAVWPVTS